MDNIKNQAKLFEETQVWATWDEENEEIAAHEQIEKSTAKPAVSRLNERKNLGHRRLKDGDGDE
jgi:hypothetical protein